jgi:hypothetical protein
MPATAITQPPKFDTWHSAWPQKPQGGAGQDDASEPDTTPAAQPKNAAGGLNFNYKKLSTLIRNPLVSELSAPITTKVV